MRRSMLAALLATALLTWPALGQEVPIRLVQGGDGTLYVVTSGVRHRVVPAVLMDEEIAAIPEQEPWEDGTLALPGRSTVRAVDRPSPSSATTFQPAQQPAQQEAAPLTFTGTTDIKTDLFWLNQAAYHVTWEVTPRPRDGDCFFAADLKSSNGGRPHDLASPDVKITRAGETNVYDVRPGAHYLDVSTTCPAWRVTLTPR